MRRLAAVAGLLVLSIAKMRAGSQDCARCHRQEATHFAATPMSQALRTVADCDILKQHPDLDFKENSWRTRIVRDGARSVLTVTDGSETFSAPLLWAFGRGQAGQTYVFEHGGSFYESRVSFYNALGVLDLTMGAMGSRPQSILEAAGRKMDTIGARDCFGCHSSGGVSEGKLHMESLTPGVGCGSCHGASERHVAAMRSGDAAQAKMARLASLNAEEMSELCGRCHRTWSEIALNGPRGVNNVRFQPYRLANSKCYDAADARIRCTACHDPHGPLETTAANYDARCTACHSAAGGKTICRTAKSKCAGCHMPKLELPGAHARFTDHQIRVVRANAPYPN
jgi:Cytochrome c554 and c-prime